MTDKLKPCPFCGKTPIMRRCMEEYPPDEGGEYEIGVTISCVECGIEMSDEYRSEVFDKWNTRVAITAGDRDG